jgi:hypothetical protein
MANFESNIGSVGAYTGTMQRPRDLSPITNLTGWATDQYIEYKQNQSKAEKDALKLEAQATVDELITSQARAEQIRNTYDDFSAGRIELSLEQNQALTDELDQLERKLNLMGQQGKMSSEAYQMWAITTLRQQFSNRPEALSAAVSHFQDRLPLIGAMRKAADEGMEAQAKKDAEDIYKYIGVQIPTDKDSVERYKTENPNAWSVALSARAAEAVTARMSTMEKASNADAAASGAWYLNSGTGYQQLSNDISDMQQMALQLMQQGDDKESIRQAIQQEYVARKGRFANAVGDQAKGYAAYSIVDQEVNRLMEVVSGTTGAKDLENDINSRRATAELGLMLNDPQYVTVQGIMRNLGQYLPDRQKTELVETMGVLTTALSAAGKLQPINRPLATVQASSPAFHKAVRNLLSFYKDQQGKTIKTDELPSAIPEIMTKARTIQDGTAFLDVMSTKDFFNVATSQGHVEQLYNSPEADVFFENQYSQLVNSYKEYQKKIPSKLVVDNGGLRIVRNDGLPLDPALRTVQNNLNSLVRIVSFARQADIPATANRFAAEIGAQ